MALKIMNQATGFVFWKKQMWLDVNTAEVDILSSIFKNMKDRLVCCGKGVAESMDEETFAIYSQGPERLTKMSGTKASCYFSQ